MVDRINAPVGRSGEPSDYMAPFKRISWGAIFAGTFVAVIVQITLSLLGLAIGLGVMSPGQGESMAESLGIGAAIWGVVTTLIALFIGGWVAAHFAGVVRHLDGALHGLVTWSLAMLMILMMLGSTISALGAAALGTREGQQAVSRTSEQAQRDAGTPDTPRERTEKVQKAEKTADIASGTALASFIMLILGAGAAIFGGYVGSPSDYETTDREPIIRHDRDRSDRGDRAERSDVIERGERSDRIDRDV